LKPVEKEREREPTNAMESRVKAKKSHHPSRQKMATAMMGIERKKEEEVAVRITTWKMWKNKKEALRCRDSVTECAIGLGRNAIKLS
jgi:hypothetical protein